MSNDWAIEVRDKNGRRFLYRQVTTRKKIGKLIAQVMKDDATGGIVIYRSAVTARLAVREADLQQIWDEATEKDREQIWGEPLVLDCETEDEENPENFEKVASSNNWLSVVIAAAEDNGGCQVCGCPPEDMPMVNRGAGHCCENHRKQVARGNK